MLASRIDILAVPRTYFSDHGSGHACSEYSYHFLLRSSKGWVAGDQSIISMSNRNLFDAEGQDLPPHCTA